jgi:hypothetical protein
MKKNVLHLIVIFGLNLFWSVFANAMGLEFDRIEISTIPLSMMQNTAFTPRDVRELWQARISLRAGLAENMVAVVTDVKRKQKSTDAEYGSVRWRVIVYRGETVIVDWYIDKLNKVFLEDGKPYTAPVGLINLLTECEGKLGLTR